MGMRDAERPAGVSSMSDARQELLDAYRKALEAGPQRFGVGQRVRVGGKEGTVKSDPPTTVYVEFDEGCSGRYAPDLLEPIPGPLPEDEEMPQAQCPKCGQWVDDYDGFGVLAHYGPGYKNPCGYCSHPAIDDGVCGICGAIPSAAIPDPLPEEQGDTGSSLDDAVSEVDKFLESTDRIYSRTKEGSAAEAIVFAVQKLGPILLDIRDAIAGRS